MSKHFTIHWVGHARWGFMLLIAFVIPLSGCASQDSGPTSTNTPQEMFEALIAQPMPDNVSDLQGVGDTGEGYRVFLRFQTGVASIGSYFREGYEETDCETVLPHFELPSGYDRFTPAWAPEAVELAQCYQSVGPVSNAWTQNGQHYFLIDTRTVVIYFYGTGE